LKEYAMTEQEQNRRSAESICEKFAWNGHAYNEGDCVALLDGKIIAVTDNPDDAISALRALEPNPKRGMVFEVSSLATDVIR
jgi:hypothetical protein